MTEPQTFKEAMCLENSNEWEQAAKDEIESIVKNKTWTLVDLPPNRKPIGCRWIFKIKHNASGNVERYKARLVAKGYSQTHGIDYDETFAPVVKFSSIRILLAIAARHNLEIQQMDVKTAYLNRELEEDIDMRQPEGFIKVGEEHKVCKLQRSLYGLKQAGRSWYKKIDAYLEELGLKRSNLDNCVYHQKKGKDMLFIALYVDDLLIFANNPKAIDKLKEGLQQKFDMKDLGEAHYCLGIRIT